MKLEEKEKTHNIRYAGFWVRFLATWVDMLILVVPLVLVVYLISGGGLIDLSAFSESLVRAQQGETLSAAQALPQVDTSWELLLEFLVAAITVLFWRQWAGATPGKKLLGIYVVDAKSYDEINNKQAIVRYISYIASSLPIGLGFLMVAFHKEKRALHDILAGTVVIYKK